MHKIDFCTRRPLHSIELTRTIEHATQASLPQHTLMQRAGLAVAHLAMAIAPHSQGEPVYI